MSAREGASIIGRILPPGVIVAEALDELPDVDLFPQELQFVLGAVTERRREFAAGRYLARHALSGLGIPPAPVLRGPNREPAWPEGVVGSITHCAGYCAAAVAPADVIDAIGIDAEINDALPRDVLQLAARNGERHWIASRTDAIHWDRILFSAKESVFKAWFPLTRRWLAFDDVEIVFDPSNARFDATVLAEPRVGRRVISHLEGRYLVCGRHVLTSVVLFHGADSE